MDSLFTDTVGVGGNVQYKPTCAPEPPKRAPRRRGAERRTSRANKPAADRPLVDHHFEILSVAANLHTFTHTELQDAVNRARRAAGLPPVVGSTVRTRCNELLTHKAVRETGDERKSRRADGSLSRKSVVWEVTGTGELRLAEWKAGK